MDIIKKVKQLNLPIDQYVVFGSGPLMVHGIRESHDIDLLVTSDLYKKLAADGTWTVKQWPNGNSYLAKGEFEADDTWHCNEYQPKTEDIIDKAEMVDGIPFAPLDEVMKWKRAFRRPKDLDDIHLIEAYLSK